MKKKHTSAHSGADCRQRLLDVLADEVCDDIFYGGGIKYKSLEMKTGIDTEALPTPLILKLIRMRRLLQAERHRLLCHDTWPGSKIQSTFRRRGNPAALGHLFWICEVDQLQV